jgi:outer membrane lipoprotein-sorting protein
MKCTIPIFFLCLILNPAKLYAQDAGEIIKKMEDRMRGESLIVEMEMEIVRPRYSRTMAIKSWSLGQDYSLILLTAPARDRGTAFLKRKKEIWNWMPGIERTIKLPPSMMSQSWMGSDFTNDDLVRESSIIDDYNHRVIGEEVLDGLLCYKIELIPKPDAAVVWGKILLWVEKSRFIQLKGENYDEYGTLVSTIKLSEIRKMDGRDVPTLLEMFIADKPGHKTIIRYHQMTFNKPIDESFFSVQNLKQVR